MYSRSFLFFCPTQWLENMKTQKKNWKKNPNHFATRNWRIPHFFSERSKHATKKRRGCLWKPQCSQKFVSGQWAREENQMKSVILVCLWEKTCLSTPREENNWSIYRWPESGHPWVLGEDSSAKSESPPHRMVQRPQKNKITWILRSKKSLKCVGKMSVGFWAADAITSNCNFIFVKKIFIPPIFFGALLAFLMFLPILIRCSKVVFTPKMNCLCHTPHSTEHSSFLCADQSSSNSTPKIKHFAKKRHQRSKFEDDKRGCVCVCVCVTCPENKAKFTTKKHPMLSGWHRKMAIWVLWVCTLETGIWVKV